MSALCLAYSLSAALAETYTRIIARFNAIGLGTGTLTAIVRDNCIVSRFAKVYTQSVSELCDAEKTIAE